MADLAHAAPLASLPPLESDALTVTAEPAMGIIGIQSGGNMAAFAQAIAPVLGTPPPSHPNTVATGTVDVAWISPHAWRIFCRRSESERLVAQILAALQDHETLSVSDLSDSQAVVRVMGAKAPALLAKGCSLDLHPCAFGPGRCARTLMAGFPVFIHQIADSPDYRLAVDVSRGDALWHWLAESAAEFIKNPRPTSQRDAG